MGEIYVIGEHKGIAIYLNHENGKRLYMHGLNPLDILTHWMRLYMILKKFYLTKLYVKGGMNNGRGLF